MAVLNQVSIKELIEEKSIILFFSNLSVGIDNFYNEYV